MLEGVRKRVDVDLGLALVQTSNRPDPYQEN